MHVQDENPKFKKNYCNTLDVHFIHMVVFRLFMGLVFRHDLSFVRSITLFIFFVIIVAEILRRIRATPGINFDNQRRIKINVRKHE